MKRTLSTCAVTAALLLFAAAPASALIIDSFDDGASVSADSGTPADSTVTVSGSFLGANRRLEASWDSGANSNDAEIDAGGSSLLNISLGADTLGEVSVLWKNIGGADLTAAATLNAIALQITFDDLPADITIFVGDASANSGSATATTAGGIFAPTQIALSFASFSGSVDFSDIETIRLVVDPLFPAADLQIDFIESVFVPEASTGLLMGLGLVALAARCRPTAAVLVQRTGMMEWRSLGTKIARWRNRITIAREGTCVS